MAAYRDRRSPRHGCRCTSTRTSRDTIDGFLDQIEAVNKEYPIKNLRWVLAHVNQPNAAQLARMKKLGMYAAVHPWAVINGGINQRVFGDAAYDMAPLDTIQKSGVLWGFGSDGSRANQILPFTDALVGGDRQDGRRQEGPSAADQPRRRAHCAHAQECVPRVPGEQSRIHSGGKLADLVVLDRDYLTIPADQIKDIQPVMTMVGGRIVYETAKP